MNKPLIIDAFPYNFEESILEIRLAELYDTVDFFVLVESNKTQTGISKPYHYLNNKSKFSSWNDKIISIQVKAPQKDRDWSLEHWQRDQTILGLNKLIENGIKLKTSDFFVLSDNDEIPSARKLKEVIEKGIEHPIAFNLRFHSYFLDYVCNSRGWWGSVILPIQYLQNGWTPQYIRTQKDHIDKIGIFDKEFWGWHFSGMGGFEATWLKAQNNVEPADKTLIRPELKETFRQLFNEHVIKNGHFLFLDNPTNTSLKLEKLDHSLLPKYVQNNVEKFKNLMYPN